MKRTFIAALSAALMLALPACTEKPAAPAAEVSATPAPTRAPDPARAAINASVVGQWRGVVTTSDSPIAAPVATPFVLTFATTSDDQLDAAYWGDAIGLTLITYVDAETSSIRNWVANGALTATEPKVSDIVGPDAAGNWSFNQTVTGVAEDGSSLDSRTTFAMQDGVLTAVAKQRPTGSAGDFKIIQTTTLTRQP